MNRKKRAKAKRTLICGRHRLSLGKVTCLMGVLNVTPDSFSDGGEFFEIKSAVTHGEALARDGADIIDIGGESTRPGAEPVSAEEELRRTIPVIKKLAGKINVPVSIDTVKSEVAQAALAAGATMVNDTSALRFDAKMAEVVAKAGAPVVLMHIRGTPRTMQRRPRYKNLIREIIAYLEESVAIARTAGIKDDKIIIDPGIGFGKTPTHNLEIINRLEEFKRLGYPVLIGVSRKSFIGKTLNLPVGERLFGTAASVAAAIIRGADIVRVHDVREMRQVSRMVDAIRNR